LRSATEVASGIRNENTRGKGKKGKRRMRNRRKGGQIETSGRNLNVRSKDSVVKKRGFLGRANAARAQSKKVKLFRNRFS